MERGTIAFIPGEQVNKGLKLGEQWQFVETGNIGNQDCHFREQGNVGIYFRGRREQVLCWDGLNCLLYLSTRLQSEFTTVV